MKVPAISDAESARYREIFGLAPLPARLPGKAKLRMRRFLLWEEDPHCHYCGRPTVLLCPIRWDRQRARWIRSSRQPDDMATLEHVVSRVDPKWGQEQRFVMACYRCNHVDQNAGRYLAAAIERYGPEQGLKLAQLKGELMANGERPT